MTVQLKKSHTARLKDQYTTLRPRLAKERKLNNIYEVPKLYKVSVSVGLGKSKDDKRMFEVAGNTLSKITGQYPVHTSAKKSIASFKLRVGQPVGLKVTLRGERMYEFVDRLINVVLPRVRDFHGVSPRSFDRQGNFSIGFADQSVFPELSFEDTAVVHGVQITFSISGRSPELSQALLESLGLPFMKEEGR